MIFSNIQLDFGFASRTVFYAMAGAMAVAFVVSLLAMPRRLDRRVSRRPGQVVRVAGILGREGTERRRAEPRYCGS